MSSGEFVFYEYSDWCAMLGENFSLPMTNKKNIILIWLLRILNLIKTIEYNVRKLPINKRIDFSNFVLKQVKIIIPWHLQKLLNSNVDLYLITCLNINLFVTKNRSFLKYYI